MNHAECATLFNRALDAPAGIKVHCASPHALASQLNRTRTAARADSKKLYPMDDPRWGASPWDTLTVRTKKEYVEIIKNAMDIEEF